MLTGGVWAGVWAGLACWLVLRPPGGGRRVASLRPGGAARVRAGRVADGVADGRPGGWAGGAAGRLPGPALRLARRLRRALPGAGPPPAEALTALTERLAALSRAGVPPHRAWQMLAAAGGGGSGPARVVAAVLAGGGTVAEGLRLAAARPGADHRLLWLATASEVAERAGAPAAAVLERFAELVRAEVAQEQERSVALAGPRATAGLLTVLPLLAPLLGRLLGADPWRTLVGTVPGRICLLAGAGFWLAGRFWTVRLVGRAARAGR